MDKLFAILWNLFWSCCFVGSIYIWQLIGFPNKEGRNHPKVIAKRLLSVSIVSLLCVIFNPSTWEEMGIIPFNIFGFLIPLILTMILFLGPIVYKFMTFDSSDIPPADMMTLRDLILAPFLEELVFRSCFIPVMIQSGFTTIQTIFITPLLFGIAHLNHIFSDTEKRKAIITIPILNIDLTIREIILISLFQACYTTLFGWITSFYFIKFRSLFGCFVVHAFCNYMGFPDTDFIQHKKSYIIGACYIIGFFTYLFLIGILALK